jgi:alpha-tubulin suppressor-like RCC1 family protein
VCGTPPSGEKAKTVPAATRPSEKFTQISAGDNHACALRDDGIVRCWGNNFYGKANPPPGSYGQVVAAAAHTCVAGLREIGNGTVTCWGEDLKQDDTPDYGRLNLKTSRYERGISQIAEGHEFLDQGVVCGLRFDGRVACWGDKVMLRYRFSELTLPSDKFIQVIGGLPGCGLREDGTVLCWGYGCRGKAGRGKEDCNPSGRFKQISGDVGHGCGVKSDATLGCWSPQGALVDPTPSALLTGMPHGGPFAQVSVNPMQACAVRADSGGLVCWGPSGFHDPPPTGKFKQVSVGGGFACALRTDGRIACWGRNDFGETGPP